MIMKANEIALSRLMAAEPVLKDVRPAGEVLKGMRKTDILHAGPPIEFEDMCAPMQGAVYCVLLYEGIATDLADAQQKAVDGTVSYRTCHEFGAVGPMTGIISWSMPLWVVEDRVTGRRSYSNISEGNGIGLRFGECNEKTLERLAWLRDVAAPTFAAMLHKNGGIDLSSIMAQGLTMGDELHMRNQASTATFLKMYGHEIAEAAGERAPEMLRFIGVNNDQFFLNLAMASNKLAADLADGVPGSTMVTAIARNGVDVGIRISGLPGRWFTASAPAVKGLYFPSYTEADANPDLGDSAIMEVGGFGGCAMAAAPAIVKLLGAERVEVASETTDAMYEIALGEHPRYQIPARDFRGIPCGIDAAKVLETGITPIINTAIASRKPGGGMIGAGMSTLPMEPFAEALEALVQELGI